jgi:hypothetical protein
MLHVNTFLKKFFVEKSEFEKILAHRHISLQCRFLSPRSAGAILTGHGVGTDRYFALHVWIAGKTIDESIGWASGRRGVLPKMACPGFG